MFEGFYMGGNTPQVERIEQLVNNVNVKFSALQRQIAHSPRNLSFNLPDSGAESLPSGARSPVPCGREGSMSAPGLTNSPLPPPSGYRPHWPTYWGERELYVAASELCQHLNGGIDYRSVCVQYQQTMELLLTLLREDIEMARAVDVVPAGTLEKAYTVFSGLFKEAKVLLAAGDNNAWSKAQSSLEQEYALPATLPASNGVHCESVCQSHVDNASNNNNSNAPRGSERCPSSVSNSGIGHGNRHGARVKITIENAEDKGEVYAPLRLNNCPGRSVNEDSYDVPSPQREEAVTLMVPLCTPVKSDADGGFTKSITSNSKSRQQSLEDVYNEMYLYEGMDMLAATMRLVFLKEFDRGEKASGEEAFPLFRQEVERQLLSTLESYEAFQAHTREQSALRCEYVVNCLQNHTRPNERLMDFLGDVSSDSDATQLSLMATQLDNSGIKPFAPLLPRLRRLRFLDISYNKVDDDGVRELCAALANHPSLEVLDISGNVLSDTSGNALRHLAASARQLKAIGQQGIAFSPLVREALGRQLEENRGACETPWSPSHIFHGVADLHRGENVRRSAGLRLPALTTTGGRRALSATPSAVSDVSLRNTYTSVVPRSVGMLQRVRLPYLTAMRRSASNSRRSSGNSGTLR
ncbi:hypothetical protein DQ04_00891050 [Trypanosoma grayi]|uniref:hypothetical protein n=1 Tax=Trypanosoma grayi TaxID=71804 RepID=UPI0004F467A9|nr:hypothetical protein DQ04_00891050 [Trypanosoma grayi]KEG13622.1 hypothetical protein DQ04_00891050 [Trypanosoma grayi]